MGLYCKCLDLAPGLRPGADPGDLCPGGTDPEALASPQAICAPGARIPKPWLRLLVIFMKWLLAYALGPTQAI